jgi:8-oxo-dGTP diphosphatase
LQNTPIFGTRVEGWPHRLRPSAYALIRNSAGEIAIVRSAQGCFLPGGCIENGETPERTIQRESKEECGLDLEPIRLLGRAVEYVYSPAEKTCFEKPSTFFEAAITAIGTAQELDHQLVWMNLEQAMDALSYESHCWAVRRLTGRVE